MSLNRRDFLYKSLLAFGAFAAVPALAGAKSVQQGTAPTGKGPDKKTLARLAAQRKKQLSRLRAYRDKGVFPKNTQRDGLLNIFMDGEGHLCAMANLIMTSGHWQLVDDAVKSDNHIRLGEVSSGLLHEWILTSGLTQEEVALIQVPDMRVQVPVWVPPEEKPREEERLYTLERGRIKSHLGMVSKRLIDDTRGSLEMCAMRLAMFPTKFSQS